MISFLSPLLLWGTLLGAIPIIIHLLNRRRFRRVQWAPMHYLKLTIQRNKRRIQIEQLLLLLMRIAAMVLLFFFLARPVLNATGLESWFAAGGRNSLVILIDDSASMQYRTAGQTAFQRANKVTASLLTQARPQDRVTVLTTSAPLSPVLRDVEGINTEELVAIVHALPPSETHTIWSTALEQTREILRSSTYPVRQLTIVTDRRHSGWDESVSLAAQALAKSGVKLRILDVGSDATPNLAIESLEPSEKTLLSGTASPWTARIRNATTTMLNDAKAVLTIDGKPTEWTLPEIGPGTVVDFPFTVPLGDAGPHALALELPEDDFPQDSRRFAVADVASSLLIRLVDGEPSSVPFGGEVDFLAAPLSVGVGSADAWKVEVADDPEFLSPRKPVPDVLVLANVAAITPEQARAIDTHVRQGMGLLIFCGPQLDVALYNDLLFAEGNGPLPCELKAVVDQVFEGVLVEPARQSPLAKLQTLKESALQRVTVRQFMTVEEPKSDPEGSVQVYMRWNVPARSPAVIGKTHGKGKVLLWTTTADRAGSDWPIEPSFVLAVREAVRNSSRSSDRGHTVLAGTSVVHTVQTSQQISDAVVTLPGSSEPQAIPAVPQTGDGSQADAPPLVSMTLPDTRRAGFYTLQYSEGPLGKQSDLYAANMDPKEGDLARIDIDNLRDLLAPADVEVTVVRDDDSRSYSPSGDEIWQRLAMGLLALLTIESMYAAWIGRSR